MANSNNFTKQNILDAVKYIDKNGIPDKNKSAKYEFAFDSGKKYPAKYVISVANHLVNNVDISNEEFNDIEARNILMGLDFVIETRQEKFTLIITANEVISSDERFTMDNLGLGDNYKPLDTYFKNSSGEIIRRKYTKGEKKSSNQTMPRLACQIFEESLVALSEEEKVNFPICQYTPESELIRGIFSSVEEFKKYRNSIEYFRYKYGDEKLLVSYCWNIFSTIIFVKECLKRFGKEGDQFVLTYREKDKKEVDQLVNEKLTDKDDVIESNGYMNPYSNQLIESKNIILRGAPGTGKSYLAKEIAADIISNGYFDNYTLLTDEQKKQIEFVQFHPSYDYSDFVEGLRPKVNNDGSIGFELRDGIFKKFVARAKKNYINAISKQEELKKYIFIIDEINRGEISKIFGELFFSIDPGYRGVAGEVSTQYSNLHKNPDEKFFIPDNVYIIGTMNDIDRSVDSFDFAMRRRFRFIEIKADERLEMLDVLGEKKEEAIRRMTALNNEIAKVEDLNENYHIGGAYFLKLKTLNFDKLWSDYLKPLLQDYVRGMYDEDIIMKKFERAYLNVLPKVGDGNDGIQD
ncbi:AAA family ATPase [Blautia sp. M16]|jgi:nucleoside-triphosphatase THEP1|uniref:AAA family ATPase n=2 Tax=Clostridia TaxID=186801 RepID=A0A8I0A5Y3_9CLOT|nr:MULTISPECIES: AAA family ATPase [Clostridia]MBC5640693.1 AAA family ATPase [Clostridium lentum]MBC5654909.1 AAA family ATPase [Blautia lenta]